MLSEEMTVPPTPPAEEKPAEEAPTPAEAPPAPPLEEGKPEGGA